MTHVLHTAKISDIYNVMFVTRTRKMVNYELRKEIEKDVFRLVTSMGQRSEVRFFMGPQNCFLCPTLLTRQKISFPISLPSLKLLEIPALF